MFPKLFLLSDPKPCLPFLFLSSEHTHPHTHAYTPSTQPLPFLLVITSASDSWRTGRRVAVSWGEVEITGVDPLFKVKRRVVFLQRLHIYRSPNAAVKTTSSTQSLPKQSRPSPDCLHVIQPRAGCHCLSLLTTLWTLVLFVMNT